MDHSDEAYAPRPACEFPNSLLESRHRFRRQAPLRWLVIREAESQEFSFPWSSHRTLLAVHSKLQLHQPLTADPFGTLCEQSVVVDPVKEFLEIQIHHPAVAFGLILLRHLHRLMCRSLGPKPIAVFRERSVPAPLQYLHHRLLDESIQHRRNAQLTHSAVRFRDFHPFYWLWCVGSVEELFADDWPVLFQVPRQFLDGHPVNAWAAFVGLHSS